MSRSAQLLGGHGIDSSSEVRYGLGVTMETVLKEHNLKKQLWVSCAQGESATLRRAN